MSSCASESTMANLSIDWRLNQSNAPDANESKSLALYEFLAEVQLEQYFDAMQSKCKVNSVDQIKFIKDDELNQIGFTKSEQRKLRKQFNKYFPHVYLKKIKQLILPKHSKHSSHLPTSTFLSNSDTPDSCSVEDGHPSNDSSNVSQHIIALQDITLQKQIGVGEFGVVQQGQWTTHDGTRLPVAIKCLSQQRLQTNPLEFLKEAAMLHAVEHKHIVRLFGVVLDGGQLMLVTELAPMRSLLECLKQPELRTQFNVRALCELCRQICSGMAHLESRRLIHRDLAARNILVFSKDCVKISDFGLSRALGVGKDYYQTDFEQGLRLPIAWCAPECILYLRFTSASDVWAFGVTLWEMFSYGRQPWANLTGQQILEAVDRPSSQRLSRPIHCPYDLYQLMLKCWNHQPEKRPKFEQLFEELPDCRPDLVQSVADSNDHDVKEKYNLKTWPDNQTAEIETKPISFLKHKRGDLITVLDQRPPLTELGLSNDCNLWLGSLDSGLVGLFNPNQTVAYLGQNLPGQNVNGAKNGNHSSVNTSTEKEKSVTNAQNGSHTSHGQSSHHVLSTSSFLRSILDKNHSNGHSNTSKKKIKAEMISSPQGQVRHTGHVGADGVYFGDISALQGSRLDDFDVNSLSRNSSDLSDRVPLLAGKSVSNKKSGKSPLKQLVLNATADPDHEYQEINDSNHDFNYDDNDDKSTRPVLDSPKFDNLDFGPSLMDEVFKELDSSLQSDWLNSDSQSAADKADVRSELKDLFDRFGKDKSNSNRPYSGKSDGNQFEIATQNAKNASTLKKKSNKLPFPDDLPSVKTISDSEQQKLDQAIARAKELADQAILELDGANCVDSPRTPGSPTRRSKFTFKFKSHAKEHKSFTDTLARNSEHSVFDSILSDEAKQAYESLIEKGPGVSIESEQRDSTSSSSDLQSVTVSTANLVAAQAKEDLEREQERERQREQSEREADRDDESLETHSNPLRILRNGSSAATLLPKARISKSRFSTGPQTASLARLTANASRSSLPAPPPIPKLPVSIGSQSELIGASVGSNSSLNTKEGAKEVNSSVVVGATKHNPLPLPPRDRSKLTLQQPLKQHERKHPLILPTDSTSGSSSFLSSTLSKPLMSTFKPNMPLRKAIQIGEPQLLSSTSSLNGSTSEGKKATNTVAITPNTAAATGASLKATRPIIDNGRCQSPSTSDCISSFPIQVPVDTLDGALLKSNYQVSCEDLLDFACDKSTFTRTLRRPSVDFDSDEIRVMQKVLANEVQLSAEECDRILRQTDGDVHKAIKCIRLRESLRSQHHVFVDCDWMKVLDKFNWNIRQATNHLLTQHKNT